MVTSEGKESYLGDGNAGYLDWGGGTEMHAVLKDYQTVHLNLCTLLHANETSI